MVILGVEKEEDLATPFAGSARSDGGLLIVLVLVFGLGRLSTKRLPVS